jgi:hypothetical protein
MFTSTIETYFSAVIETRNMLAASFGRPCDQGWFHGAGVVLADAEVPLAGRRLR